MEVFSDHMSIIVDLKIGYSNKDVLQLPLLPKSELNTRRKWILKKVRTICLRRKIVSMRIGNVGSDPTGSVSS